MLTDSEWKEWFHMEQTQEYIKLIEQRKLDNLTSVLTAPSDAHSIVGRVRGNNDCVNILYEVCKQ